MVQRSAFARTLLPAAASMSDDFLLYVKGPHLDNSSVGALCFQEGHREPGPDQVSILSDDKEKALSGHMTALRAGVNRSS